MSQTVIGMIPPWGGGSPPNVSTPFPTWLNWSEAIQKVASISPKIADQVAYG